MRSVEFYRGIVAGLASQSWVIKHGGVLTRGWYVKAELRNGDVLHALYTAMHDESWHGREMVDVSYIEHGDGGGVLWVRVRTFTHRCGWLAWIIEYLSQAGHLDRNQELTAYVSFGLPYLRPG